VPGLFLAFGIASTGVTIVQRPVEGLVGLGTLGVGVLAYFAQRGREFGQGESRG
jgi:hypothetical protein